MCRTKPTLIYPRTGNLLAVLPLGHTKSRAWCDTLASRWTTRWHWQSKLKCESGGGSEQFGRVSASWLPNFWLAITKTMCFAKHSLRIVRYKRTTRVARSETYARAGIINFFGGTGRMLTLFALANAVRLTNSVALNPV